MRNDRCTCSYPYTCPACRRKRPIVATVSEEHVPSVPPVPPVPPMTLEGFKKKMAKLCANTEKPMTVRVVAFGLGALSQHLLDASQEVLGTGASRKPRKKKA